MKSNTNGVEIEAPFFVPAHFNPVCACVIPAAYVCSVWSADGEKLMDVRAGTASDATDAARREFPGA